MIISPDGRGSCSQTVQFSGELGINHMSYTCYKGYEGKIQETVRAYEKEVTT